MKFSVLINNFNYGRFLIETLHSVNQQLRAADEIIVVDDCSSDHSVAILNTLSKSIPTIKIITQPNAGQLSAFRTGIHASTGDWLFFLDADDTWEPTHLAAAEEVITSQPELGLYYSGHQESSGPPMYRSKWPEGAVGPCAGLVAARGSRIGTITSALCLKREFAMMAVSLDESFDLEWRTRADDCLVFGASIYGAVIYYNPIQSVNYRIHENNAFAGKSQDPQMIQYYDRCKWRMIAMHSHKAGIGKNEILKLILREFKKFPRNQKHPYYRSKFFQGLLMTPAPMGLRVMTLLKFLKYVLFANLILHSMLIAAI